MLVERIRMNRIDLQSIAETRIKEAKFLLDNSFFSGSFYLMGYSIECSLKACIAKQTKEHDFPDLSMVKESYTHNLVKLLRLSNLETEFESTAKEFPILGINWSIIKEWSENSRYTVIIEEKKARELYNAITEPEYGVMTWLKKYW